MKQWKRFAVSLLFIFSLVITSGFSSITATAPNTVHTVTVPVRIAAGGIQPSLENSVKEDWWKDWFDSIVDWSEYSADWYYDGENAYNGIQITGFHYSDDETVTVQWYNDISCTGFHIYRTSEYDMEPILLGSVLNEGENDYTFTDQEFCSGIPFQYSVVPYREEESGIQNEMDTYAVDSYTHPLSVANVTTATRSGTKVTIQWSGSKEAQGYEIYQKYEDSSYKRVKSVSASGKRKAVFSGISKTKKVSFKVRGYVVYQDYYITGEFGKVGTVYNTSIQTIVDKIATLQKKYPKGKYWNHVGKKHYDSTTITNKPCNHGLFTMMASTCNKYNCPNGVIGYQCYGFAWKMSDLIFGRNAKIKNHKSYKKAMIGDVVRYHGHSIIIIEKYPNYVIAGECNSGNTCIINWGRQVPKSDLTGATYSHRY